jgi:hypothetical protein
MGAGPQRASHSRAPNFVDPVMIHADVDEQAFFPIRLNPPQLSQSFFGGVGNNNNFSIQNPDILAGVR